MATESSFYLSEVAGSDSSTSGSGEDLFDAKEVLDTSTLSASVRATPQRSSFALRTPPMSKQRMIPSSTQRWDRGPMSPFSPLAKSDRGRTETSISFVSNADADLSLISCRKVSVAVSVHVPENNENSQKLTQLCLFPLNMETPYNPGDLLSPISATIRQAAHESTRDLVVVNPSAFGTHIPGQVTMETARLVAQVAHIESEDWARKYRFDDVSWCCKGEDTGSVARLAESLSNDAILRQRSVVCFAMGNLKSTTLFGSRGKPRSGDLPSPRRSPETLGLLGMVFNNLLKELPENSVCTLSLLEILDDDTLRDMLSPDQMDSPSKLKIRHLDHRGAVLQNQTDAPLDSLTGLELLLRNAFYSQPALRLRKREGPRGHVVCTLKIWENAVQRDLDHTNKCVTLQLVDLSSGHDEAWMDAKVLKRMASARKSLSVLRGVLRGLVLQEISGETNTVSYRECTLTKILQRILSEEGAQAVILASVSAQSAAYERTLHTLNYVNRLLIRPGKTAQSPFDRRTPASKQSSPVEQVSIEQFGSEETLLKSVTSDPRQRLAKLMGKSPAKQRVTPKKLQLEESYQPTDYMAIDPGNVSYTPMESLGKVEISSNTDVVDGSEVANVSFEPCYDGKGDSGDLDSDLEGRHEGDDLGRDLQNFQHEVQSSVEVEDSHESLDYTRQSYPTMVKFQDNCDYDLPDMPSILIDMRNLSTHEQQFQDEEDMINGADLEMHTNSDERVRRVTPTDTNCDPDDEEDMLDGADFETQNHSDDGVRRVTPSDTDCDPEQVFHDAVIKNGKDVDDDALVEQWMEDSYAEGGIDIRFDKPIHRSLLVSEETTGPKDGSSEMSIIRHTKGTGDDDEAGASNMEYYAPSQFSKVTKTIAHEAASPESNVLRGKVAKLRDNLSPCLSPVISDKKSTAQTNTVIAQERNTFNTRDGRNQFRSPEPGLDTSFVSEIHSLQGAVDEVKRMHNGLWESSATSLQRLKNFQEAQQRQLDEAVAERLIAERYAEEADKELMRRAEDHRRVSQDYKKQIEELKRNLGNAIVERSSVEKIAEEAIVSQARTEEELCMCKGEFSLAKRQLKEKEGEVDKLLQSRNLLMTELDASRTKSAALTLDHSECGITIAELEAKVKTLDNVRSELMESITADRGRMAELISENTQIGELNMKLDLAVQEVQRLKNACGEMQILMSKQQSSALESSGVKDAELHLLHRELSMLTQELSSSKQQLDDMKGERLRGDEEHKRGLLSLSNELRLEREHVRRLREELESSNKAKEAITMHVDRTNDLLLSRNDEMKQLQVVLRNVKKERDQAVKHMETMKEAVGTFQTDTKEHVARIVEEKRATDASLDRALTDMKVIEDSYRSLTENAERCRREQAIADQTIASLREQADQLEKQKAQLELEKSELSGKFGQLELTIESLKCQLDAGNPNGTNMQSRSYNETELHLVKEIEEQRTRRGTARRFHVTDDPYLSEINMENDQIRRLEKQNDQLRLKLDASSSRQNAVSMEVFRAEQSRRIQAEDLTAVISAKAKNGFEDRNDEIVRLKVRLSSIVDEKESEIRMLRVRLLEMEKQQIGTTPEPPRRYHSDAGSFSRHGGSGNDRGLWGM